MTLLDEWKEKQPPELAKAPKRWSRTSNHFETFCPEGPALRIMALVVYIPRRRLFFVQPGAGCQGCIAPPFYGGLPLTVCPGCAISPASDGGISSRAAPFPMIGKGRGDWVELSY